MAALDYVQYTEAVVAENHPTLTDVTNRPVKSVLTASGLATTVNPFPGFLPLTGGTRTVTDLIIAGGTPATNGISLSVAQSTTTATSQYGIKVVNTTSSASTVAGYGIYAISNTAAAAFVQTNNYSVYADNPTAGAGSTITNNYGIYVVRQTAGGTLNYGLRVAGGASRGILVDADGITITAGGLYVTAGNIGVGATPTVDTSLYITGGGAGTAVTQYGALINVVYTSSATTSCTAIYSQVKTGVAAFTATNVYGLYVDTLSKGAGSAVTNNYGIYVNTTSGGATINYGIYIAGGTPALYVAAGGIQVQAGNLGIGITSAGNIGILLQGTSVAAVGNVSYGTYTALTWNANSTTSGTSFYSGSTTNAAAFTLTNRYGYYHANVAKGAGSTITNDYGIFIEAPTQGATINYGIYVAGGTPGIFVNAGGMEILAGNLGLGIAPQSTSGITVSGQIGAGTSQYGIDCNITFTSGSTTRGIGLLVEPTTAAAAFTCTNLYGIYVDALAKGAGSTITNRYGLYIVGPTDGGTINAAQWVANGDVILAGSGSALATGATSGFTFISNCAGTPTGVPTNAGTGRTAMQYDTTANKIWFYNGSWRGILVA